MANKKVARREEFEAEIDQLQGLPSNYAGIIHHYRPDLTKRRIWNVRHKKAVDFDVLAELKRVAREAKAAKQLVTA
jgi:hypothetical protein